MIPLQVTDSAVLLPVKAQAGARRSAIVGEPGGRLKVAVKQVAEKGKANEAICKLVAESLGLARSAVTVSSGATASLKVLRLEGVSLEMVHHWLARETETAQVANPG